MPDPQHITSDPDFLQLPPEEQQKVLVRTDSNFAALPSDQQSLVISRLGAYTSRPAGLPAGVNLPGIPAPPNPITSNQLDTSQFTGAVPNIPGVSDNGSNLVDYAVKKIADAVPAAVKGIKSLPSLLGLDPNADQTRSDLANGLKAPMKQAQDRAGNPVTKFLYPLAAGIDTALGGDASGAMDNYDAGNYGKAAVDALAVPAAFHVGAKVIPGGTETTSAEGDLKSQLATRGLANEVTKNPKFNEVGVWPAITERLRQAARDSGVTEGNLKDMFPTGDTEISRPSTWMKSKATDIQETPVQQGFAKRIEVLNRLTDGYNNQYSQIVEPYRGAKTAAGLEAAAQLRNSVSPAEATASPKLAAAVNDIADRLTQAEQSDGSLGAMDDLRKEFNKAADRVYQQRGQAGASPDDLQVADANRRAADAIRDATYDQISDLSGVDKAKIQELQREHGLAINYSDEAMKQGQQAQANEAEIRRKGSVWGRATGPTTESSVGKSRVVKRLASKTPQAEQNSMMRAALSNLGEGGANPSTTPAPDPVYRTTVTEQKTLPRLNQTPAVPATRVAPTTLRRTLTPLSRAAVVTGQAEDQPQQ